MRHWVEKLFLAVNTITEKHIVYVLASVTYCHLVIEAILTDKSGKVLLDIELY